MSASVALPLARDRCRGVGLCALRPADRAGRRFCCPGCAAAHDIIEGLGLGRYYRQRVHRDRFARSAAGTGRAMGPCSAYRRQTGWHEGIDARRRRPAMRRVRLADRIRAGQGARRAGRPRQHDHSPLAPGVARRGRGCEPSGRADRGAGLSAGAVRHLGPGRRAGSHRADADAFAWLSPGSRQAT